MVIDVCESYFWAVGETIKARQDWEPLILRASELKLDGKSMFPFLPKIR